MQKVFIVLASAGLLLGACGSPKQSPIPNPATAPVISKLELAQTHVIPAAGKSWSGNKLASYNLHLVGNREALVLIDFAANNKTPDNPTLEAWQNSQKLGEVTLNPPNALPKTEDNAEPFSTTAFSARLEKSWVRTGLELRVRSADGQVSELQKVKVGAPAEFITLTLPFYLFGLTENAVPLSQTATADQATRDEYLAKHPFADLQLKNHPAGKVVWSYIVVAPRNGKAAQKVQYKEQQGDGYAVMSAILNTLGALGDANGDASLNNHYYAPLLMANQAGKYSSPGGGLGGGHLGTGDFAYSGVFIHEAGHAFGMPHANDGFQAGTYPYVGGSLKGSSWGFDLLKNRFLTPVVPSSAETFKNCRTSDFPMGRQFDALNRCLKQDPMQSGAGDQVAGDKYTMFSDFNASVVQKYLEGDTTIKDGKHVYSGGRVFVDPTSATGYSRWDTLDSRFAPEPIVTKSGGIFGLDNNLPIQRNVPVRTIILTANIASIADTFIEEANMPKLSYQDTVTYQTETTQIYEPISYTGNLRRVIDATIATQLASIVPNTSENYWYCLNSGCDYTLKIAFSDGSQQLLVLQGGFRGWYSADIKPDAANPLKNDSYRVWGVNISAQKPLQKLELLETPEVWKGLPAKPKVIASRTFN